MSQQNKKLYFLRLAQIKDPNLFVGILSSKMTLEEAEKIQAKREKRRKELNNLSGNIF